MTIAYWCVLIAGVMPFLTALPAKATRSYDNGEPRAWAAKQQGFRARGMAAHANAFEAFPLFAAAVIIAHQQAAPQGTLDMLAMGFIAARVGYTACYYADLATLRSTVWFVGVALSVAILTLPAWA